MFKLYEHNLFNTTLLSQHCTFILFAVTIMFLQVKINLYFKFRYEELCLQALLMHASIGLARLVGLHDSIIWEKISWRDDVLICKRKNSIIKNIPPSRDRVIFTCNLKNIFKLKRIPNAIFLRS